MEKKHRCILCGAFEAEKKENGEFYCYACKGRFAEGLSDSQLSKAEAALGKKLDERDERQLCNAIHSLWNAVHEEYIDKSKSASIIAYCQEVQKYLPDDIRAKFYKAVCEGNNATVNGILKSDEILSEENRVYLSDIIEFAIRSLNIKSFIPIKELIEKAFDGELQIKYINGLEEEAGKLKEGVYDLSGDVFIAYSSKDLEWVKEICEYLENEENQLRCFYAYRNLRHVSLGTNSGKNDYWENLKTAMKNCTCVVFLSSENSRDPECEAIDELNHLRYNLQDKPRIEYIRENGEEYALSDCVRKVQIVLANVFKKLNWCRTKESLRDWAIEQTLCVDGREKSEEVKPSFEDEAARIRLEAQEEAERILREAKEEAERVKREAQERAQAEKDEQARAAEQKAEEERKAEAERVKREAEAARKKVEAEEAARKVEEERKRQEEAERKKTEAEEAERKKREAAINNPTLDNYDHEDFEIINAKLLEYNGTGGDVKIPHGITEIGKEAFSWCSRLTSIEIPNSITLIGDRAFAYCKSLTSITIPNSVTSIGEDAFEGCSSLTNITIPNGVTSIERGAFRDCSSLTSIEIPNSVTSIGEDAFWDCKSLTNIIFKGTQGEWDLIDMGYLADFFEDGDCTVHVHCTKEEGEAEINYPTLNNYDREEFGIDGTVLKKYKGKGGDVKIPQGITEIEDNAFRDCGSLTSITIPNGVTTIGNGAFKDCSSLTSITIPNSVTSIGYAAFRDCSSLTSIEIPNGVTSIGESAFDGCSSLTNITIPNGVTSIGNNAFRDCSSLTSIEIPNGVTSIGESAFDGCSSLTNITIPNGVTSIGNNAFEGCSSLTNITIPGSVTKISLGCFYGAFKNCSSLTSISVSGGNKKYHDAGNCLIETETKTLILGCKNSIIPTDGSVTSIAQGAFYGCSSLTSITIPNSVTKIGGAFYGCSSLTSITIPNSVTSIGWYAFQGCSSLTSITIPNSVTSIGGRAFEDCHSLTSITIPNSVTMIDENVFRGCDSLTSITIPNSVTSIGDYAFCYCSSLTNIIFEGTKAEWNAITKGSGWNYDTGEYTVHCTDEEFEIKGTVLVKYKGKGGDVKIPQGITKIESGAFCDCRSLTSITIPNSVTEIGSCAFSGCSSLTSITIPNSVKEIGEHAFGGCSSLTSITIPGSVISIGARAFDTCDRKMIIYCKCSKKQAKSWGKYWNKKNGKTFSGRYKVIWNHKR